MPSNVVSTHDPDAWHDKLVFITALVAANKQVSAYVLRILDADAGRAKPPAPADEYTLGSRLVDLGSALIFHATKGGGNPQVDDPKGPTVPGASTVNRRPEVCPPWADPAAAIYTSSSI